MNVFQLVFGTFAFLAGGRLLFLGLRGRTSWLGAYFWGLLWIAAGLAIFKPEITSEFATALGITRGADLVIYLAILAGIVVTRYFYSRTRRLENLVTQLVREKAIETAVVPDTSAESLFRSRSFSDIAAENCHVRRSAQP